MKDSVKTKLILMLDREFDKTIDSIATKSALMDRSRSFTQKAQYAQEAAELEEYASVLFNLAQQILEA
jgi:hypothetical protein